MTEKRVKNEQWYVKELANKVDSKEICKPKYQRKRKWDILPKKENVPSEKQYIEFLFENYNSVYPITFGHVDGKFSNIDGNNRINAILHFLEEPFSLFPEYLKDINTFFDDNIKDEDAREKSKDLIKKISYDELMNFKYNKYFIKKESKDFYEKHLKSVNDESEAVCDKLISCMQIRNKDRFDNDVKIIVNLFEGYSTDELSKVFGDINKYNTRLTEIELLACRLYNTNEFTINDNVVKTEITNCIKAYYENRADGEVLHCYSYDEKNEKMNAYDFIVGFQNYANKKCSLIHETDNEGLSIFFKIYKTIYKGNIDDTFTTENVNSFITHVNSVIDILIKIKNTFVMEHLEGSGKIFDTCNKKIDSLKKNNMYIIISAIIGYLEKKTDIKTIIKSIETCIIFHFFVNDVSDKEKRDSFKINDTILYETGGGFIDAKSKELLKFPENISNKITGNLMETLLIHLIQENVKNKKYEVRENGKDKLDKRRPRKFSEKALIYYYYKNKIPCEFLDNKFWIEHIVPFSSSWNVNYDVDIDRLGNIIPVIDKLNNKRSNQHISTYNKIDKEKFMDFLKDIIPSAEDYDKIVSHKIKKPEITDSDKFNIMCDNNEKRIVKTFIKALFE
jgi:hypothetical protein